MDLSQRLANLSPKQREQLEKRLQQQKRAREPIAVVGMSCRFPGAHDLDAYWDVIRQGVDATQEIPVSRWDMTDLYDPTGQQSGKMSVKRAGLIEGIDQFDPRFFGISPREAARMDPQQRLLLEVAWEALEVGAIPADRIVGKAVGVYVGIGGTDYSKLPSQYDGYYEYIDAHVGTGNALSVAANRISYIMDLRGPSMAIDTACSSSTMAIHLAVQSLRARQTNMALAGGVNAIITPETTIAFSKARMLSPNGRCRPFDASANGYVRGEGCGMLVLKRLADAVAEGDIVFGVIRGTATNQDGRTSGITAPNGVSQQAVIRAALTDAGIEPDRVNYVEAHGTGTPLGDPIEIDALSRVFPKSPDTDRACLVTSVKANVGHMETVSGVAGIIKILLMMRHGLIPAQAHLEKLNPEIKLKNSRLQIPNTLTPFPAGEPLVAGASSFGFGGANTHVVLEQPAAPSATSQPDEASPKVILLSGKSENALSQAADRLKGFVGVNEATGLADIAYTSQVGRVHHGHRASIVAANHQELQKRLGRVAAGKSGDGIQLGQVIASEALSGKPKLAMLFTGQGAQEVDMGRGLFESHPLFANVLRECDEVLRDILPVRLLSVLYPDLFPTAPANGTPLEKMLHQTRYTQPALFAVEYALAHVWEDLGVRPDCVIGHSVGQYTAAAVANVMDWQDALRLVAHRGRLMNRLPAGGRMEVIFGTRGTCEEMIQQLGIESVVSVAAENGPSNTVVAGDGQALEQLCRHCDAREIQHQPLQVSHAFHSPLMEPVLDDFRSIAAEIEMRAPEMEFVCNVTGEHLTTAPDADYWCRHIRQAVRFATGVQTLALAKVDVLLECGPSPVLIGMARRCEAALPEVDAHSLRKSKDDSVTFLNAAGVLHVAGLDVDWSKWTQRCSEATDTEKATDRELPKRICLPTYPFEKSRCWLDPSSPDALRPIYTADLVGGSVVHPLLGAPLPTPLPGQVYRASLSTRRLPVLADHVVQGSISFPGAGFLEIALAAGQQRYRHGAFQIQNLTIDQALFLKDQETKECQTVIEESGVLEVFSRGSTAKDKDGEEDANVDDAKWVRHLRGRLVPVDTEPCDAPEALDGIVERLDDVQEHDDYYQIMSARRLDYGPAFRILDRLSTNEQEALGIIECLPEVVDQWPEYQLHPVLGDALMQTLSGVVPKTPSGDYSPLTYMPTGIGNARVWREPKGKLKAYARRTEAAPGAYPEWVQADLWLLDSDNQVVAMLESVRVARVGALGGENAEGAARVYQTDWRSVEAQDGVEAAQTQVQRVLLGDADDLSNEWLEDLRQNPNDTIVLNDRDWSREDYDSHLQRLENVPHSIQLIVLASCSVEESETLAPMERDRLRLQAIGRWSSQLDGRLERIDWLTVDAQPVVQEDVVSQAVRAAVWGAVRVAANEGLGPTHRLMDLPALPGELDDQDRRVLLGWLQSPPSETEAAIRAGKLWVPRIRTLDEPSSVGLVDGEVSVPKGPFRLRFRQAGSLDSLYYEPMTLAAPGPGEVQLQVQASGLNFSDVLKAMGLYPGITDAVVPLGIECAGTVTAVGDGVDQFAIGDAVFGVAPFAFGSHATTPAYTLIRKPKSMDPIDAATIPITFLTAWHALVRLADLQPGERILIHAGAGGVGLAAIQIAQWIGAEVYTTAGSDEKRDFLRSIGVEHVFNSRTTEFADQIRAATGGEGIDVVLNSLPGEMIPKSLGLLRAYGRFLEIGKTDIYQNSSLGLAPFQDNLSYHAIDLDRVLRQRPAVIQRLFSELQTRFDAGDFEPLACTEFADRQVADAFRYMSQRRNIGKVIVRFGEDMERSDSALQSSTTQAPVDARVALITGGTGAIGVRLAGELLDRGFERVVLLSRRGETTETQLKLVSLRERGTVTVLQADVTDFASLRVALGGYEEETSPVTHVYHAAGVLADGMLRDMSPEQYLVPLRPKVAGTANLIRWLQERSEPDSLQSVVFFSSIATLLGSPGQSNYAAGNAALDAMAAQLRQQGVPAISIQWGPWDEGGMASDPKVKQQLLARGMRLIPPDAAIEKLMTLAEEETTCVAVMDIEWDTAMRGVASLPPRFSEVAGDGQRTADHRDQKDTDYLDSLAALPSDEAVASLKHYFASELARLMEWDVEEISVSQPLADLGMDSLIAMEMKSNLEQRLGIEIPMAALVESPSIESLVSHAERQLLSETGVSTDAALESSPLVCLQQGDPSKRATPTVLVHPLGGNLACYSALQSAFGSEQMVYGIVCPGSDGMSEPPSSMDTMLDEYVDHLRLLAETTGSLELVGWSAGGVFALELAHRLEKAGVEVASVVMIDSPLPSVYDDIDVEDDIEFQMDFVRFSKAFVGVDLDITREKLATLDANARWELILHEAQRHGLMAPSASIDLVRRLVDTSRCHVHFLKSHQIQGPQAPVHLLVAADDRVFKEATGQAWTDHSDWESVLASPPTTQSIHGNHFSILIGGSARLLVEQLAAINEASMNL
ncbi:MAG: SDR family NAD(P)-dependent oxidoreductase [Planctomycetota bacterium]